MPTETDTNQKPKELSPKMLKVLGQEERQAKISAIIDAALEEGITLTPEEARQKLQELETQGGTTPK